MKLILTGTVENLSTRQDGTVKISFGTQELDNDNAGRLFHFRNKYCKVLLSDDNITKLEENLVVAESLPASGNNKSPSQRLRSVLYRVHEQSGFEISFEQYYETEMEKIRRHYLTKLEPAQ